MTVEEMVIELWEGLGKPENLNPLDEATQLDVDDTKENTQRLRRVLSWAQNQVTSWKDGKFTQRMMFWTGAFLRKYLQLTGITDTGQVGSTEATFVKSVAGPLDGTNYEGYVAINGSEAREIVADTGSLFIVSPSFTNTMLGEIVTVRPLGYDLPDKESVKTVQQVWIQDTGNELEEAPREERFMQNDYQIAAPTQWFQRGRKLYLDVVPDQDYFLKLVVEAVPTKITELGLLEEPEIPPQFHWAIVLWALGWGHGLAQEETRKLAYQAEFRDFMRETINESDMDGFLSNGYGIRLED